MYFMYNLDELMRDMNRMFDIYKSISIDVYMCICLNLFIFIPVLDDHIELTTVPSISIFEMYILFM